MKYYNYCPMSKGMSFGIQQAYNRLSGSFIQKGQLAHASITNVEALWVQDKKPYYNISPDVKDKLLALDLSLNKTEFITLKTPNILLRFAENGEIHGCQSILVGLDIINTIRVLVFAAQGDWVGAKFCCLPFPNNETITDIFARVNDNHSKIAGFENRTQVCDIVQIICGTAFAEKIPDVLARDMGKPFTENLVERAKQRGKYGWTLEI